MATVSVGSPTGQLTAGSSYSFIASFSWEGSEFPKHYDYYISFQDANGTNVYYETDTVYLEDNFWDTSISVKNVTVPLNAVRGTFWIELTYNLWGGSYYYWSSDSKSYTVVYPDPDITKQPVLSLGSSSGASVNMTWTAAEVSYADGATIYYQFFVGPSSTYSDSYHVGTTDGLSHTMTEAEIISQCGNGFGASSSGSVCYLFVRAYWQKGSSTGGWSAPTGVAFTYFPTINAPTSFSLSPTKGKTTSASWTNQIAGNNSQPQSVLRRNSGSGWVDIASGISSVYPVPESVWKALGKGSYELCIAHEWYGRYANSSSINFEYSPENTVQIDGDDCVAYLWDETESAWKLCDPYIWDEGLMEWVLCSTT